MNEHDPFEQRLRRQPMWTVPPAWREEILAQAKAAAAARQQKLAKETAAEDRAALIAGWRLLFSRLPLAWASLAALWLTLIGVNLMLPSPMVRVTEPSSSAAQMESLAALELQPAGLETVGEQSPPSSHTSPAPKRQQVPVHPRSERRRNSDFSECGFVAVLDHLA